MQLAEIGLFFQFSVSSYMREIYKRRIGVENAPPYEEGDEIMKMKTKRFLSVVAMVLAFLIAFNTTSVAMGDRKSVVRERVWQLV